MSGHIALVAGGEVGGQMLPSDAELVKIFHLGRSTSDVAREYGVSRQAVSKRWRNLGLLRRPVVTEVQEFLSGTVEPSGEMTPRAGTEPWSQSVSKLLRLVLRARLGDSTLSSRQERSAAIWLENLVDREEVVVYTSESGWTYSPAEPGEPLLVRWPTGVPLPEERYLKALARDSSLKDPPS